MIGNDSSDIVFRTISGWLKGVTERYFTPADLKSGDEFTINRMKVRTYKSTEIKPNIYSILLSHPDHSVKGRQWITEIGIREDDDKTIVSILLETSDISTLVKEIPSTTKPRLVRFLQKNGQLHSETIGLKILNFSNAQESLKALSFEIDRKERKYPLVLISNKKIDNEPVINPQRLQEQLLGLAQVVHSSEEINSWEMESILTRRYSAWDGAINIIYPSFGGQPCNSKLFSQFSLNEIIQSGAHALQHILSHITHTTNGLNKKKHFSPSAVREKRQKDQRTLLKQRFDSLSEDKEYQYLAEQAFSQLEDQENLAEQVKLKHEAEAERQLIELLEKQEENDRLNSDYISLQLRFKELQSKSEVDGKPIIIHGSEKDFFSGEITELVVEIIKDHLESAKKSSRRYDLLEDIYLHNKTNGNRSEFLKTIKSIFSGYNGITPKIKNQLKKLNIEVIEEGTHNHIKFIGDERYKISFAKTPSDAGRVGLNIVRDIKSQLL